MSGISRRTLLRSTCAAMACGAAPAMLPQLNLLSAALASNSKGGGGYRALVCVYLDGGNDSWNLLIPGIAGEHAKYATARNDLYHRQTNPSGLAIPHWSGTGVVAGQTLPASLPIASNQYALNPFCPELQTLHNEGRLAFLSNVGTLVQPHVKARAGNLRPAQLYSHSDQTTQWQLGSSISTTQAIGWGGQLSGLVASLPTTTGLSPVITLAGQTRFLNGVAPGGAPIVPFALTTSNTAPAPQISNYAPSGTSANQVQAQRRAALEELIDLANPQAFSREYQAVFDRSLFLAEQVINPAMASIATNDPVNLPFEGLESHSFVSQLRQVARVIKVSTDPGLANPINADRQIFFVRLGGFDTHSGQITSVNATGHHLNLQRVSQAVHAFFRAMQAIGREIDVTLFSASEFGRTLNSNGDGTDHAWGAVQFVLGGAVNGGVYGRFPSMVLDNSLTGEVQDNPTQGECYSRGQFIPTLAVDQVAATLSRWMGLADSELPTLFPNIDNFAPGAPYLQPSGVNSTPTFAYPGRIVPGLMAGVA
ncbi:MAG: DUF1501 domain-containing protein [Xanthomonadales bacterium]|nr:DUF1501 domain-containing protein [Xanthomonadales bacterium]